MTDPFLIVYTDLDAITAPLFIRMIKEQHGIVDQIHVVRNRYSMQGASDADVLMKCTTSVVLTCWDVARTKKAVTAYAKLRKLDLRAIRIYSFVKRYM
jgi:hypothetical protein